MRLVAFAGLAAVTLLCASAARAAENDATVPTYHGDAARSGLYIAPSLTWANAGNMRRDEAFDGRVPGNVYAQPLYWHPPGPARGLVIVVTEDNAVAALDAITGTIVWQRNLGNAVARSALPCGNINPLGITGTPVIDGPSRAIYLDAVVDNPSGLRHLVFALSLKDGSTIAGWPVDVEEALRGIGQRFNTRDQNQRGALTILDGSVYVPFGGHFGDCGDYHGWVVGISIGDPKSVRAWSTRASGGGIWAPGGISSDGRALYVATGNTMNATNWGDGEAVIRLAPDLHRSDEKDDYFAPSDWLSLDEKDADLGGANPLLLDAPGANGAQPLVLALGKDRRAYLLDRRHFGGVGGALTIQTVARGPIRTAPVTYPSPDGVFVVFQGEGANCAGRNENLTALEVRAGNPPSISTVWCAGLRGRGSPIVTTDGQSNYIVWAVGAEGDERLHGYRGDTGQDLVASDPLPGLVRRFATILCAEGRLYVAGDGRVFAFGLAR
jgi:hypothetical protein